MFGSVLAATHYFRSEILLLPCFRWPEVKFGGTNWTLEISLQIGFRPWIHWPPLRDLLLSVFQSGAKAWTIMVALPANSCQMLEHTNCKYMSFQTSLKSHFPVSTWQGWHELLRAISSNSGVDFLFSMRWLVGCRGARKRWIFSQVGYVQEKVDVGGDCRPSDFGNMFLWANLNIKLIVTPHKVAIKASRSPFLLLLWTAWLLLHDNLHQQMEFRSITCWKHLNALRWRLRNEVGDLFPMCSIIVTAVRDPFYNLKQTS